MSRDRGIRLQNALAEYLRQWWPDAESAGSGRPGRDVLRTPAVWWENKTGADGEHRPGAFMRKVQAAVAAEPCTCGCSGHDLPVVVWWPPGVGNARPELAVAMLPLTELMGLLVLAGYAPAGKDVIL